MQRSVAKVTSPSIAEDYPRERLFEALDEGRGRPLVWICGPGGAGKTHLLASYVKHRDLDALWYHVDHGDTDIASFFYYLGLAGKKHISEPGNSLPLLNPDQGEDLSRFTFRFFEELFRHLPLPGLVVFDNLQEVHENAPLYRVILEAASRLPPGLSFVIVSRNDPPARFAPLRAARTMKVLDWYELNFTAAEFAGAADILGNKHLSTSDIDQLHDELEGWIAGLVLILEQARLSGGPVFTLPSGTTVEIMNVFASQVWDLVQPEVRDFLLKTACLPFMTGSMAQELTGVPSAEKILSHLTRNNFFTLRFEPGPRYRYHNLFREFLLRHLDDHLSYDDIVLLKKTAAALLFQEGYPEESAELLIEEKEWDGLASLIKQAAPDLFDQGRIHTVHGWLQRVPRPVRQDHPWLMYWLARCAVQVDPASRRALYQRSFILFENKHDPDGLLLSWAGEVMTYLHSQTEMDNLDILIHKFADLETYFENSRDQYARYHAASSMFVAITFRQPNHPEALTWESLVRAEDGKIPDLNTHVHFLLGTALRKYFIGDIEGFGTALAELEPDMGDPDRLLPNNRTMYPMLKAIHKWLKIELDGCHRYVREGLSLSEELGGTTWDGILLGQQINASLSDGNLVEAKKGLELYRSYLDRLPPLSISYYYQRMAWYCLAREDPGEALFNALEGNTYADLTGIPNNQAYALLVLAEVYAALGEEEQTQAALLQARRIALELGNRLMEFQCDLLQARISYGVGRDEEGDKLFDRALGIGARDNIINWQFLCPLDIRKLVTRGLTRGIEVNYILDLIRQWDLQPGEDLWNMEAWPWPFKIYTLGRFEVLRKGEPLRFEGKTLSRPLDLLKAIIALGGRDVAAERLIEFLWTDSPGDAGHRTLETNLHRLRQLLGTRDAVELKNGRLALNPQKCWVDIWAFERAFNKCGTILTDENSNIAKSSIGLYRGTFLPSCTQTWAASMRDRVQSKFCRLLDRYGNYLEDQGKNTMAIDCYLSALDHCPLAENIYQKLMLCYEKEGLRAEAMSVCQRCSKTLMADYGIGLSRKTIELCERIRESVEPSSQEPFHYPSPGK